MKIENNEKLDNVISCIINLEKAVEQIYDTSSDDGERTLLSLFNKRLKTESLSLLSHNCEGGLLEKFKWLWLNNQSKKWKKIKK